MPHPSQTIFGRHASFAILEAIATCGGNAHSLARLCGLDLSIVRASLARLLKLEIIVRSGRARATKIAINPNHFAYREFVSLLTGRSAVAATGDFGQDGLGPISRSMLDGETRTALLVLVAHRNRSLSFSEVNAAYGWTTSTIRNAVDRLHSDALIEVSLMNGRRVFWIAPSLAEYQPAMVLLRRLRLLFPEVEKAIQTLETPIFNLPLNYHQLNFKDDFPFGTYLQGLIFKAVWKFGPLTIAELSKLLEKNPEHIRHVIRLLSEIGFLESHKRPSSQFRTAFNHRHPLFNDLAAVLSDTEDENQQVLSTQISTSSMRHNRLFIGGARTIRESVIREIYIEDAVSLRYLLRTIPSAKKGRVLRCLGELIVADLIECDSNRNIYRSREHQSIKRLFTKHMTGSIEAENR